MGDKSITDVGYGLSYEGLDSRYENEDAGPSYEINSVFDEVQSIDDQSVVVLQQNDIGRSFNSPECVMDALKYMSQLQRHEHMTTQRPSFKHAQLIKDLSHLNNNKSSIDTVSYYKSFIYVHMTHICDESRPWG